MERGAVWLVVGKGCQKALTATPNNNHTTPNLPFVLYPPPPSSSTDVHQDGYERH